MEREKLSSRLGFILLSAGCAIGIGNVWKFPYITGQNGGGIFVLIYLFFLIVMGVPVLTMEFSMGRAAQKSVAKLYHKLEPKGSKWHIHGYFCLAGNIILMMFYTTVSGYMLNYFVKMATGTFEGLDPSGVKEVYSSMQADPLSSVLFMAIVVVIGFLVCAGGVKNGLERITKYMMLALLAIMVVLAINSIFLPGGDKGLSFYLVPDVDRFLDQGPVNVIVAAMNQAFFTLSLGIGGMAIFGSYIDKKRSLMGEAVTVAALDTFVAFCSGLIIFPACFAYNVQPDSGPNLIFVTLPNIFNNIPLGRLWGSLFFVFMGFAALSTVFTVLEGVIAGIMDLTGWSRKKTCLIGGIGMFLLSLPCALGTNLLAGITPFGEGSTIMDLEDFAVSNILLPLGSLIFVVFCTIRYGWGWKNFTEEANTGKGIKVQKWMRGYMTFILPLIVITLFVMGIINFFS
ncbi:MAG: sodium-dependent transporter [Ruminiclostridium sp.]|nr:sodium-dependent transporter [Ruminiclostridium sp.]